MDTQPKKRGRPVKYTSEELTARYRSRLEYEKQKRREAAAAGDIPLRPWSRHISGVTPLAYRQQRKEKAFALLGGCCAHCGEKRPQVLVIDHIKALRCRSQREREERREKTAQVYTRILRDPVEAAKTYQILCANCNFAKGTGDHVPL